MTEKKSLGAQTLLFPTPTLLVCAYDADGKANMAAVAWGGICNSKPPCVSISLRAATYTHGCIMQQKAFCVAVPSEAQVSEADYAGMASGRDVNKFDVLGWDAVKSDAVNAPYPAQCPLIIECELVVTNELGLHTQFVGEVKDVKVDSDCFTDEKADILKVKPIIYAPGASKYYGVGSEIAKGFSAGKKYM